MWFQAVIGMIMWKPETKLREKRQYLLGGIQHLSSIGVGNGRKTSLSN
jgi:hypothetical protein